MTRTTDTDVSLTDRYTIANNSNIDLFVSCHCNSSNYPWSGTSVIYPNNHDIDSSKKLAETINPSIVEWTNLSYNKVYEDTRGLAVLRGTNKIAVLTETGYMSSNDIDYMINHLYDIAFGIGQGIHQYFADSIN